MSQASQAFEVCRDTIAKTRTVEDNLAPVNPGELLLRVDAFALTANNITYAITGDLIGYWQFFPAAGEGWGRIPVWGFGEVQASGVESIEPGERFYGYYPMAGHLRVAVGGANERGFADTAAHRCDLPAVYNQYLRCSTDPFYQPEQEAVQMLFRPLFTTAFFIDDFLAEEDFFGAGTVLIASASSKTALALAWLLHSRRREQCRVVGLTSPANRQFVQSLGCYDEVFAYDDLAALSCEPSVLVDMAGNAELRSSLHHRYREQLKYSCSVGATHWEAAEFSGGPSLPGPRPEMFFAPTQVQKRTADWGAAGVAQRLADAWAPFTVSVQQWISVRREHGSTAVDAAYQELLHNRADPKQGFILSMHS